jgi:hypothetical protein
MKGLIIILYYCIKISSYLNKIFVNMHDTHYTFIQYKYILFKYLKTPLEKTNLKTL